MAFMFVLIYGQAMFLFLPPSDKISFNEEKKINEIVGMKFQISKIKERENVELLADITDNW